MLYFIDLFCGAGGTTTGIEFARKRGGDHIAKVIACVNHDENAIRSHSENHPDCFHFIEDVRTLNLGFLVRIVKDIRASDPLAKVIIWASLECTNFSRAKGGVPRDADSRTLALDMYRYIKALDPDCLWVENISEFKLWGPLRKDGMPNKRKLGKDFREWVATIKSFGYEYGEQMINSADLGASTSRNRFFAQFNKPGLPIVWPTLTHSKKPEEGKEKWVPVRDCIDYSVKGKSIFGRKKPLSPVTIKRIVKGIRRHVINDNDPTFFVKYYSTGDNVVPLTSTGPTLTTKDRLLLVNAYYMDKQYSGDHNHASLKTSGPTLMTRDKISLVDVSFIVNPQFDSAGCSVDKPCFTLIARMDKKPPSLVTVDIGHPLVKREPEYMQELIDLMIEYNIADIKVRTLTVKELLRIQGFPDDYKLVGTQAEQKKYIGNSVVPRVPQRMCLTFYNAVSKLA